MGKFQGKKLLLLGTSAGSVEIVKYARSEGAYVIVTDYLPPEKSEAKLYADESAMISTTDINALCEFAKLKKVDAVFCGVSEINLVAVCQVAERLGLPCYFNKKQWDLCQNKANFKKMCQLSKIAVPIDYSEEIIQSGIDGAKIKFPVIIKPVDGCAGKGIYICNNKKELKELYGYALDCSTSKKILVEEYLSGDEVMVYFTVHNGIIDLSAMCDRYMYKFKGGATQLPVAYYFPSKHLDLFLKYNLEKFQGLIKKLGIQNGLIAFQSFVVGNDVIPFDPTYRLDGTMAYHMIEKLNNINIRNILTDYAFFGSMGDDKWISEHENPHFTQPTFELPILLRKGTITSIFGVNEILSMPNVIYVHEAKKIGDVMQKQADFTQICYRIHIWAKDNKELKRAIEKIYSTLCILDENGEDMIIGRFDCSRLGDAL